MHLSEIIGQSHAYKLGQLLIEQKPRLILVTGPMGCGKTSYAEALTKGFGGEGVWYRSVPDEFSGDWSVIDGLMDLTRDQWGRLIDLVDQSSNHVTILVTPNLDKVPRGAQSRSVRVSLRALQDQEIRSYAENLLVRSQLPYSPQALDRLVLRANGDLRVVQGILGVSVANNGLTEALLAAFGDDLPKMVSDIFRLLADGYLPESKQIADQACLSFTSGHLAQELLNQYSKAWSRNPSPTGDRIRYRFPDTARTSTVLLKWFDSGVPLGSQIGSVMIHELDACGIRVDDPRVVEERRKADAEKMTQVSKGRPELNLDPLAVANRKNLDIPIYEDKSITMDPRVREQLRKEAEAQQKQTLKSGYAIPSSIISTSSVGDSNPFGLRIPSPGSVPKGVILGTQFVKLARAKKVTPEEKWDLVYQEKDAKAITRSSVVQKVNELKAEILSEDNSGFRIKLHRGALPEVLSLAHCEVETC